MAEQTVTFTRRPGVTDGPEKITVSIDDANGDANTTNDAELKVAAEKARTDNAGVDLSKYTASGYTNGDDAYKAVVGGGASLQLNLIPSAPGAIPDVSDIPLVQPTGYNEVGLRGRYLIGLGKETANGPGVQAYYGRAIRIGSRAFFVPQLTLDYQSLGMDTALPGGGDVRAGAKAFLPGLLGGFRFVIPGVASDRLSVDTGVGLSFGYAWSPNSTIESVKAGGGQACIDAGGTPSQCNRSAGDLTYNTGRGGWPDPRTGGLSEASGFMFRGYIPIMLNGQIPAGSNAVVLGGGAAVGLTHFAPGRGGSTTQADLGVIIGAGYQF
jgi:hypothetical protein